MFSSHVHESTDADWHFYGHRLLRMCRGMSNARQTSVFPGHSVNTTVLDDRGPQIETLRAY